MSIDRLLHSYLRLRAQSAWSLLAADNGPVIVAVLQTHLGGEEKSLTSSVFHERVERNLEELRASGQNIPRTAQSYIAEWLRHGYLERRFLEGALEESYSLSVATMTAVRFASSLVERRAAATESRLAVVIQQVSQLAIESNPDPRHRVSALEIEQDRINKEIAEIQSGSYKPLDDGLRQVRQLSFLTFSQER